MLLERSAKLLEAVVTADPADLTTRSRVAENSLGQGHAYMVLASSPELTADARLARWRQAKAQLEKGAAFWVEMRDRGVTVGEPGRQARPNRPRDRQV